MYYKLPSDVVVEISDKFKLLFESKVIKTLLKLSITFCKIGSKCLKQASHV